MPDKPTRVKSKRRLVKKKLTRWWIGLKTSMDLGPISLTTLPDLFGTALAMSMTR